MKLAIKVIIGVIVIMGTAIYSYYIAFNHYVDDDIKNNHKIEKGEVINNKIYTMNLGVHEFINIEAKNNETIKYSIGFEYKILEFDENLNLNKININLQNQIKSSNIKNSEIKELKNKLIELIKKNLVDNKLEFRELILKKN